MHIHSRIVLSISSLTLPFVIFAESWEHIVLADCTSSQGVSVSHMAYYPQTLTKAPKTVAVVQSFYNQTAMWIRNDSTLSATFPDAIVYSANLSGAQNQGDLAGYGSNGFGLMNCWKYDMDSLYTWYNGVICDAVYDCNRQGAVGDSPDALRPPDEDGNGDAKKGNNIALGVGIGLGVPTLLATLVGVVKPWRRRAMGLLHSSKHVGEEETISEDSNQLQAIEQEGHLSRNTTGATGPLADRES